jgi:hypothetical protein
MTFVGDFLLHSIAQSGECDAYKENDGEPLHVCGVLTDGKRAFLIKRLRFFPSVDIR